MGTNFSRAQISNIEIFGVKAKQNPMPQWLSVYENKPLWAYQMILKYKGTYRRGPRCKPRILDGRCVLSLRTSVRRYDDLVTVQGHIRMSGYSRSKAMDVNFVPKQEIYCPLLTRLVADYIGHEGLSDRYFDEEILFVIQNSLFSCNRKEVPLICGYNREGLLDRVSVNMKLFQPVNL